MTTPFIEAVGLTKIYQTGQVETVALNHLTLQIKQGDVVAILGASGSGKSTFLNILGGLDQPTAGQLLVGQVDLTTLPAESQQRYRQEVVGFVWQEAAQNLLPYLNAKQNLLLPMKLRGIPATKREQRATELLAAVNMAHRARAYPNTLSGGEQQRLAIGIALANRPGILLADEPTGSVDSDTTAAIMALFKRLAQQFGVTIIMVTHDLAVATQVDQCFAIQDGRIYNSES